MAEPTTRRQKITKSAVDRVVAPARGQSLLWDTQIPGFVFRVRAGGKRTYCLKYRVGGRQRWTTLGEHGVHLTPEQARVKAFAALRLVSAQEDPQARKEEDRRAVLVKDLAQLYLTEGRGSKPTKRQSSWATDESRLRRHVLPLIGKMRIKDVTKADVERMQAKISAGGTAADERTGRRGRAIVRGGALVASGCVTTLAAMFAWAVDRGLVGKNPAKGVKKVLPEKRERFLSAQEARGLLDTLHVLERERTVPASHASIFRLLTLTGARKSEILGLLWKEVDFDHRQIRLPRHRSKTGERAIALNEPAFRELARLPQTSPYVFPNLKGGEGHTVGLHKSWRTVRAAANLADVRIHDLRHSFASFAADAGEPLMVIGKALGHKHAQTTERYAHLTDSPVRRLVEKIGAKLTRS